MTATSRRRREVIPFAMLVVSLIVTAAAARYAHVAADREDQLRFEHEADRMVNAISNRLDAYVAILLGGAGLFAASEDVTRSEFRAYVVRLQLQRRYPGIQGVGYSRRVRAAERGAVVAAMRKEYPSFDVWPEPNGDDFTTIVFLEPDDERNRRAVGFDMTSQPTRAAAMARARDSGKPAASGKVRLVQEGDEVETAQAGFLIYVPVYRGGDVPASRDQRRRDLLGFVYSPLRADDLLRGIMTTEGRSPVRFEVFDGTIGEARLMHRSEGGPASRVFERVRVLDLTEHSWTVVLYADESLRAAAGRRVVTLVAIGGGLLSLLLFAVMRGQVAARTAAERTAEELRTAAERLRAADRAKDEFLAIVSHELRTPLNAILGWASLLGRGTLPENMYSHAFQVIGRNASAQARLVEDLLDMSRVAGGHLRLQLMETSPAEILETVVESFRPAAAEAKLRLVYEPGKGLGTIQADPGRLQQIVSNLLSNSIKFTPEGGSVTPHVAREADTLVIRVSDTGIGMDPGFVPFVFERFRQADSSTTRLHPGTGLGLAIARHLVELHGGTIEAASEGPGRGATFTVRLPAVAPQPA